MAPGHVLTSMVKRVDTQAYDMVEIRGGRLVQGRHRQLLRAEGGRLGAAMDEYNKGLIPDDVLKQVESSRPR